MVPSNSRVLDGGLLLVQQVSAALSTGDPLEGLPEAAACIADALGFEHAAVLALADSDPSTIYLIASSDEEGLTRVPFSLEAHPELAEALRSRQPVFSSDSSLPPSIPDDDRRGGADTSEAALGSGEAPFAAFDFIKATGGRAAGSLLVLPLTPEGRAVGCVVLRSIGVRSPPDEADLLLLRVAVQVIAVALRSGRRLVDALREQTGKVRLAELEDRRRARRTEHYRTLFGTSSDGVVVVDADLRIHYLNRAAEQLTGYAEKGLLGRDMLEILPRRQHEGLSQVVRQAAAGAQLAGFDFQINTTSGEPLRLLGSVSTALAQEGVVALSFRDVTEARVLEDELRSTKEFFERLIDAAVDGIVASDMQGRVVLFNNGAERVFGYLAEEVIGWMRVDDLYPEGMARQIMTDLRSPEHGGVGRLEPARRAVVVKSGEMVPVQLAASIIYEEGFEVATVGIFSDLRERVRMEQRLNEAQEKLVLTEKQALIAELAGTTSHELNQPLTSVMGYAELLLKRTPEGDPNRRALEIVLREAERMAEIVRKIGRITKYETKAYVGGTTILDLDKSATEG